MLWYDLWLAWEHVRTRPVQTLVPALVVALAVGLSVAVLALGDGLQQGIVRASDAFGVLVVGAKGSAQQLVLNTVLLQGAPVGNIPYTVYEELAADPRARLVIPMAKGDSVSGAPIIGTNRAFFQLRTAADAPLAFQIAQGRLFDTDFEAVLGSTAAVLLGLTIGDQFRGAHGFGAVLASDVHDAVYTVVGILHPSLSAYDTAVFTTLESVWEVHHDDDAPAAALTIGQPGDPNALTAILVQPVGFIEANQLWQTFYVRTDAQAAFPGAELGGVFDLLRQGVRLLVSIGYLVLGAAALTVFLAIYNATVQREQILAVMRSLGCRRSTLVRMVVFEALLVTVLGALLGRLFGYGGAALLGAWLSGQAAIAVPVRFLPDTEPILWTLTLLVGSLAAVLPAVIAYRVDIVRKLFPV